MKNQKISETTTHFGYQEVPINQKTDLVTEVFNSVANKYDLMNDLMSLGIHRLWKSIAVNRCEIHQGHKVLDCAGGSGDLSALISPLVGDKGQIILADINEAMLKTGRDKLLNQGLLNIKYVQANAEQLPFTDCYFDRIIIGFGLRNITNQNAALSSFYRILKPGGRLIILEFSTPQSTSLKSVYDWYSFKVLPRLGKLIAKDEDSYRYLAESIRMHPDQETLKQMILAVDFDQCRYYNLSNGIVAIHCGVKY